MKTCSRCKNIKPLAAFSKNATSKDGLQGWCQTCVNERVNEWHDDNPDFVHPQAHATLLKEDPIEYSRRNCAHVANYIRRAIERLERFGLEPPPQLTAIHDLASRLRDEQQDLIANRRRCLYCGDEFQRKAKKGPQPRYCSDICKQRMAWLKRDKQSFNTYKRRHYHEHKTTTSDPPCYPPRRGQGQVTKP